MTIEMKLKSMMVNYGLFPDMADKIMEAVKADPANAVMAERWGEETDGYPVGILSIGWHSVCQHAVKVIDQDAPEHWARPIFANKTPGLV